MFHFPPGKCLSSHLSSGQTVNSFHKSADKKGTKGKLTRIGFKPNQERILPCWVLPFCRTTHLFSGIKNHIHLHKKTSLQINLLQAKFDKMPMAPLRKYSTRGMEWKVAITSKLLMSDTGERCCSLMSPWLDLHAFNKTHRIDSCFLLQWVSLLLLHVFAIYNHVQWKCVTGAEINHRKSTEGVKFQLKIY